MKEEQVDQLLYDARDHIPVDESLKKNLRNSFRKKRKPIWQNIWLYGAAVAAIIIFSLFQGQGGNFQEKTVSASTLKITNALSFLNIGSGEITEMAHKDGHLYISTINGVYLYEQDGMKEISKELAEDIFIEDDNMQVFERDGKIITLKNDKEQIIDNGTEPSVSKDGLYIAYVKEVNGVKDVWISDMNGETKKKVTTNPALYNYMSPEWSSVDRGLFVMKQRNQDESGQFQIMKVDLGEKALNAEQTVSQFLQALIVRDDDYAKSFMEHAPEILTISNPHQTGYRILSADEKDGSATVKAEVTWSYTANAYSMISTYEFKLASNENGYTITQVTELNNKELTLDASTGKVKLNGDEILFSFSDVPTDNIQSSNYRISSFVLNQEGNQVIFTIQEMQDGTHQAAVDLFTFDLTNKTFTFLDKVKLAEVEKSIGISEMSLDESGKYLALDVFLDEPPFSPYMLVYDLDQKKQVAEFSKTTSQFWQGNQLLMQKMEDEQLVMLHWFDPLSKN